MRRFASSKKSSLGAGNEGPQPPFPQRGSSASVSELTTEGTTASPHPYQLVELAQSSLLVGNDQEGAAFLARAHQAFLSIGEKQPAARCAFWLGFTALLNGDVAQASGWLSRSERLLEDHPDCVEKGYLFLPVGFRMVHGGEAAKGYEAFDNACKIGERFRDADLMALARQGQGRCLIRQGEIARGVSLLDEAMVAVTAGECTPLTAGGVYCSVLDACGEIFDLRRAQEWTSALERWCASQPDVVPYRGHCMVRRAEILQLHGAWQDAIEQARQACQRLSEPSPKPEAGAAFYRLAELYRVRGEFAAAEDAYREANRWQRTPQPGLALLRFAQGQKEAANAAIRRIAEEVREPSSRARVLDCYVEIVLAVNDVASARTAAEELVAIAERFDAPLLHATASRAIGAVLLAEHDAKAALAALRRSWEIWHELDAPYEAARTRVLMAQACGELDDCDAANFELELAREVFQRLGAIPDLAHAVGISPKKTLTAGPLTAREVEVLRLISSGKTNRGIASKLGISEKTVARHVSNIFNKLNLTSRAAATAYAYQRDLV